MSRDNYSDEFADGRSTGVFSLRRSEILADLAENGSSTSAELASRLGRHVNTLREHLGHLIDARFVIATTRRSGDRGRPRIEYALADAAVLDDRDVRSAVDVSIAAARLEGRDVADPRLAQRAVLTAYLERHGFEPTDHDGTVVVSCPIARHWSVLGERVCRAHLTVITRVVRQVDGPPVDPAYSAHAQPGVCHLTLA